MKRLTALLLAAIFTFAMIAGCSATPPAEENPSKAAQPEISPGDAVTETAIPKQDTEQIPEIPDTEPFPNLTIVCTMFPQYDWVRNILGEHYRNVELTLLQDTAADLHSYQPSAPDLVKISGADLFIYVGGHSDESWVDDALQSVNNTNLIALSLMENVSNLLEEEHDDHDSHEEHHDENDDEDDDDEDEVDEHIWLSLRNAAEFVEAITAKLISLAPDYADDLHANSDAYIAELNELDETAMTILEDSIYDTIIFADRFPFLYMLEDYGIKHYAAFSGCSAETEASFSTIKTLAEKFDELELKSVAATEFSDGRIAMAVLDTAQNSGTIYNLNSMQSITAQEAENGATYLEIMRYNLSTMADLLR